MAQHFKKELIMLSKKLSDGLLVQPRAAAQEACHSSCVHFHRQQPQRLQMQYRFHCGNTPLTNEWCKYMYPDS